MFDWQNSGKPQNSGKILTDRGVQGFTVPIPTMKIGENNLFIAIRKSIQ